MLHAARSWAPFHLREAGIWVQVLLRLLHGDFFYFWFDVNGAPFRGAGVIDPVSGYIGESREAVLQQVAPLWSAPR